MGASSGSKASGKAAPKPQAYRPPGARGAGGGALAAMLRTELGSTAGESSSTANKVIGGRTAQALPPGMAPQEDQVGAGNSRNARRKKAKEAASAAADVA